MGEAADDAWDDAFTQAMDLSLMVKGIRENCGRPCLLTNTAQDIETEDWLPYVCLTCGKRFDFP